MRLFNRYDSHREKLHNTVAAIMALRTTVFLYCFIFINYFFNCRLVPFVEITKSEGGIDQRVLPKYERGTVSILESRVLK